jgi:hypothetical protein
MLAGMVPAPPPMVEGADDTDYNKGNVTRAPAAQERYVAERAAAAEDDA